jgi:predicted transcriptional regulator
MLVEDRVIVAPTPFPLIPLSGIVDLFENQKNSILLI